MEKRAIRLFEDERTAVSLAGILCSDNLAKRGPEICGSNWFDSKVQ